MEIWTKLKSGVSERRQQEDMAAAIADLEELAVEIAEVEVIAGNLEIESIPERLQDAVRVKLDDSMWKDK